MNLVTEITFHLITGMFLFVTITMGEFGIVRQLVILKATIGKTGRKKIKANLRHLGP